MSDAIHRIDELIAEIESTVDDIDMGEATIVDGDKTVAAKFVVVEGSLALSLAQTKQTYDCVIRELAKDKIVFRAQSDVARSALVQISFITRKSADGEFLAVINVGIPQTTKIPGGYEFTASVKSLVRQTVPAHRKFLEFLADGDAAGWNRWCADLDEGPQLCHLDLSGADLSEFDLACADLAESNMTNANLSGATLAGANLRGCLLEGVRVQDTDFYRAVLPRSAMGLLQASGLVEIESVRWVENPVRQAADETGISSPGGNEE